MVSKSTKLLFMSILMMSLLISISANSWFIVWMGMEINMMSFMPIIMEQESMNSSESALTYFMVQTIASMLMLMSIIMIMINNYMINSMIINNINSMLMISSLMIKMGMSPFHSWIPKVMEGLKWNKCLILMTMQKLIPMMIMSEVIMMNNLIMLSICLSITIGSIGGINQISIRSLMAYSSISNSGWMMAAMLMSEALWMLFFLMYVIITAVMTVTMNLYNIYFINQINSFNEKTYVKFIVMLNMLSMSGLPPMLGFLPKWMVVQSNMTLMETVMLLMMLVMSLIMTMNYLRLMFTMSMLSNMCPKWNNKFMFFNNTVLMMISIISMTGLSMITLIISLY